MLAVQPFRALAHRNFRLYFFGQGISVLGTWMQQVASAWLVYTLSHSAVWLGLAALAGQLPSLFLAPLAGAVIERFNRQRLVLLTQSIAMIQAFLLAALALTGMVEVWHILVLSLLVGASDAFDIPARQVLMTELVGDGDDLANAIALNSSIFNGARLLGPALAGLLLATTSAGICFLTNGISYLAVLGALRAMRLTARQPLPIRSSILRGIGAGFGYAWSFAPIRALLLLAALVGMAAAALSTLLPIVATVGLHGGARTLGGLTAAIGAGALAGSVLLALRKSVLGLGKWIVATPALFGLGLVAFSFPGRLWAALLLLVGSGCALLVLMASVNMVLQTLVADRMRGRVMSLLTMAVTGVAPLGGLLAGLLADRLGTGLVLRLWGAACVAGSLLLTLQISRLRHQVRAIYVRKGIAGADD